MPAKRAIKCYGPREVRLVEISTEMFHLKAPLKNQAPVGRIVQLEAPEIGTVRLLNHVIIGESGGEFDNIEDSKGIARGVDRGRYMLHKKENLLGGVPKEWRVVYNDISR